MAESSNTKRKAPLEGFQHGYHVMPRNERSLILCLILRQTLSKHEQVVVFFSSKFSVLFHQLLLQRTGVTSFAIHEELTERQRKSQVLRFSCVDGGILLCTDAVARRPDIRDVDLVIQYDPSCKEYNNRAALIEGSKGRSLLLLNPEELPFLNYLKASKVPLEGFAIDMKSILDNRYYLEANFTMEGIADGTCNILYKQNHLEFVVFTDPLLSFYAKEAYRSYVLAYTSNAHRLDLQAVAASFGLNYTPDIEKRVGEEDDELIQMSTDWGMVMKTEWEWYLDSRKLELGKKELRKTQKRPRMVAGERRD